MYFDEPAEALRPAARREPRPSWSRHRGCSPCCSSCARPAAGRGPGGGGGAAAVSAGLPLARWLRARARTTVSPAPTTRPAAWPRPASRRAWSLARRADRGRGRHGRAWASPPGNLYVSLLLRPRVPARGGRAAVAGGRWPSPRPRRARRRRTAEPPAPEMAERRAARRRQGRAASCSRAREHADGRRAWLVVGIGVNLASCPAGLPDPATSLGAQGSAR